MTKPTLPNFLVLGAQRGGTTYLHALLEAHPQVFLPSERKELHYFDQYFDRGTSWYAKHFRGASGHHRAVGEVTPRYLFDPLIPRRIAELIPNCLLVAILRNPADRAYSQYGLSVRDEGETRSFEEFIGQNTEVFERGLYARQLKRYLQHFPKRQIHVMFFEHLMRDGELEISALSDFLGIDPQGFVKPSKERRNASFIPRFRRAYVLARRCGSFLRSIEMDWIVNTAKKVQFGRIFGRAGYLPRMDIQSRRALLLAYEDDIRELERLLDVSLPEWRE